MKKKYLGVLLGAAALFSLAACSNTSTGSSEASKDIIEESGSETESESSSVVEKVLKAISAEGAKEKYYLGDDVVSGMNVTATFDEGGKDVVEAISDLSQCEITIKDSKDEVVADITAFGEYKVIVKYQDKEASFTINVVKPTFTTIEKAIKCATAKASVVNGGVFIQNVTNFYGTTSYSDNIKNTYSFGDGFAKYVNEQEYANYTLYVVKTGEDSFIPIRVEEGIDPYKLNENLKIDLLRGYGFKIEDGGAANGYGADELVKYVYDQMALGTTSLYEEKIENDTYSFSYKYISESTYNGTMYSTYTVSFKLGDYGNIETATVDVVQYVESSVTVSENGETFTVNDGATPKKVASYSFEQTVGAKLTKEDNPYDADKILIKDFSVKVDGEALPEKLECDLDNGNTPITDEHKNRQKYTFTFDITPETADLTLDNVNIYVSGKAYDGKEFENEDGWNWETYNYFIISNGNVTFCAPGEYEIAFKSELVTKTVKVNIIAQTPYEIGALVYEDLTDNSIFAKAESYEMFTTDEIYVKADIADGFDQSFVVTADDNAVTLVEAEVNGVKCYKLTATAAGTYNVTIASGKDSNKNVVIPVTVKAPIDVTTLLTGEYQANVNTSKYLVKFNENGTFTITDKADSTKAATLTYTYSAENGLSSRYSSGENFGFDLKVSKKYQLYLEDADGNKYYLGEVKDDEEETKFELDGKFTCQTNFMNAVYTFVFKDDSITVSTSLSTKTGTYSYTYTEATGAITYEKTDGTDHLNDNVLKVVNGYLYFVFNDTEYVCLKEGQTIIAVDDAFIGTWKNSDSTIVITKDSVTIDGDKFTIVSTTATKITLKEFDAYLEISSDGKTITDDMGNTFTKDSGSTETTTIPAAFVGTWNGTGDCTDTVVFTENSATFNGVSAPIVSVLGNAVTLSTIYDNLTFTLSADGTKISDGLYDYAKAATPAAPTIPESLIGFYISKSDSANNLELKSDKVLEADGMYEYKIVSVSDTKIELVDVSDSTFTLTLTINADGTITNGYNSEVYVKKVVTPTIPESLIGYYVSKTGNDLELKEDKVLEANGMYTYNIVSVSATEIKVVDSEDSTYTMIITINADGTITNGNNTEVYTKKVVTPTIPESLIGYYVSKTGNDLELKADKVLEANGMYTYNIVSVSATEIKVVDSEDSTYTMIITINADGTITNGNNTEVYTKKTSTTITINSAFVGDWYDATNNVALTITADSVKLGDTTLTVVSCTATTLVVKNGDTEITYTLSSDGTSITSSDSKTYASTKK